MINKIFSFFSFLVIISTFFADYGQAAIFSKKAPLFYKSPSSQFASGQRPEEELERKKIRSEMLSTFQVSWDQREFQYKHDELVKEIQVADQCLVKLGSAIYKSPKFRTKEIGRVDKNEVVKLIEIHNSWALVERFQDQKRGYIPLDYLESFSEDSGLGFTATSLYLKETKNENSKIITTIPQKERVKIIFWDQAKIYIQYKNFQGYVDSELVFMKADFASMALHFKKGWLEIKHREGPSLRNKSQELIPISEFKAYITNKYRAYSLINKEKGPKIRSRLEIKNLNGDFWNVSELPEHGEVWWKKSFTSDKQTKPDNMYKTEEILHRKIYSMAFYPESKIKGIISAEGVFKTLDGQNWKKIEYFKNENWPVAISKNKTWIVGQYKSTNEGESFEPFIRWDNLSKLVEDTYSLTPKFMKLIKIEASLGNKIDFLMDTGSKKVKMRYSVDSAAWTLLK